MKKHIGIGLSLAAMLLAGCGNNNNTKSGEEKSSPDSTKKDSASASTEKPAAIETVGAMVAEKGGIKLSYFMNSPEFADASLKMEAPKEGSMEKVGKVHFGYKVENYELKGQTMGADACGCSNSKDGQHIHLILNDQPYRALYKPEVDTPLPAGHYVALSFLSRSYHESIKNGKAWQLSQFSVGSSKSKDMDLKAPILFYSRPKGEYKGKDTKTVLLDFFLANTDLSETGNKVRATINGNEFMITKWAGYAMQGLPMGKTTIKLELLDKDNKPVPGEYNKVERTITLKEE